MKILLIFHKILLPFYCHSLFYIQTTGQKHATLPPPPPQTTNQPKKTEKTPLLLVVFTTAITLFEENQCSPSGR